jgi:gamma-glutamyltranspeptidase
LRERRGLIQEDRALDAPPAGRVYGDTTYLTVVDRNRHAVSLITSISDVFGSGVIVPETGVILHNRGAAFEMDPAHPNHADPGKRVRHSILPSMVLAADGSLALSFGCMGANMQPQGQAQILVNLIDRGMDLQQALDARGCERSAAAASRSSRIRTRASPSDSSSSAIKSSSARKLRTTGWSGTIFFDRSKDAPSDRHRRRGPVRRLGPAARWHRRATLSSPARPGP